ncbi:alpha/beta hydrolase [Rhodanobacter aciditrophus]|uniref:alpha/beta hydrolase n=1 Tax=Rhodanobacter aciditrophus TaxID=1623218 RepID=UPI003CED6514
MLSMLLTMALATAGPSGVERTIRLPTGKRGEWVALHCMAPPQPSSRSVLFVHGSSFPTDLASGYRFAPGDSWLAYMAARGYQACGLDFRGFGDSSRPPAMKAPAAAGQPVERAHDATDDIAVAVRYLHGAMGMAKVHLVAHSWGTIPAAAFAARDSAALASLTLFGPIVPVPGGKDDHAPAGAWFPLTAAERLDQLHYKGVLPAGLTLLEPAVEARWAAAFRASVPHVAGDPADRLRIPNGPNVDIVAAERGHYPYDPAKVRLPVFVVYGSYDTVVNDAGAATFLARFTASPLRWRLRIDDGTHVMHLERNRHSLYAGVAAFIEAAGALAP